MEGEKNMARELGVCVFLAVVTAILFSPLRHADFLNYDDQWYVTSNPHVKAGLTGEGIAWAFGKLTGDGHTYWHPLTWLSHMIDVQLFGLNGGKHHLTNVFFHITNTLLLFGLLRVMTGALWRSALVAALFAWHPLQVGTVGWIAERKNLLGTLFGLLSILAYVGYVKLKVQSPKTAIRLRHWTSDFRIWAAVSFFAFSLMCKPLFITLPCILLLLDFWPLKRPPFDELRVAGSYSGRTSRYLKDLLLEKIPFFVLSMTSAVLTMMAHKTLDLLLPADQLSPGHRLSNTLVAYFTYVRKIFWPDDLAVYYPLPGQQPASSIIAGVFLVSVLSLLIVRFFRTRPYLFTGWFWFLGALVPFIGLVQANDQAMADRFAYVPLIGFFIALVWGIAGLLARFRVPNPIRLSVAILAIGASAWATSKEVGYWKSSETLFARAIKTSESNIAHINYAAAIEASGDKEKLLEAKKHYERAIELVPNYSLAESNLGVALAKLGHLDEALPHFLKAIEINPDNADAHSNLGLAYAFMGRREDAIREYKEALRIQPDHPNARQNLANALAQPGKP